MAEIFNPNFNFNISSDRKGIENLENYGIIPHDTLHIIFQFLPLSGLLECSCSCKLFYCIIQNQIFWKEYYLEHVNNQRPAQIHINNLNNHNNWKKEFHKKFVSFQRRNEYYKKLFFNLPKSKYQVNHNSKSEYLFKIVSLGDSGVGKTSLLIRHVDGFYEDFNRTTIGVDFKFKMAEYNKTKIKTMIWDLAGEERFRGVPNSYFRGSNGILFCFSIDNKRSFDSLNHYFKQFKEVASDFCECIFVGLKCDLEKKREVEENDIIELLKKFGYDYNTDYCECSSKEDLYTFLPFGMLLDKILWKKLY